MCYSVHVVSAVIRKALIIIHALSFPDQSKSRYALTAQPHHESKLNDVAVNEEKLRASIALAFGDGVASGCVATNAHALIALIGQENISQTPKQKECVRAEAVEEDHPADPGATDANEGHEVREQQRDNDVDELVTAVRDKVQEL